MPDEKDATGRIEGGGANPKCLGTTKQEPQVQQSAQHTFHPAAPISGLDGSHAQLGFLPFLFFTNMSGTMFRLAHISDIHLAPMPQITPRELVSKRITGYVNWHRNRRKRHFDTILDSLLDRIRAAEPHHLAITGDLVNLAAAREIATAARWLRTVGEPDFVSLVPGNHDAYVPGAFKKICAAWRPYMLGDDEPFSTAGDNLFPFLRRRDGVALIGVSTAAATPPFFASGLFGPRQANRLAELLEMSRDCYRIILIHHPPVRGATNQLKRMLGIGRFTEVLQQAGAELVLHGHTHLDTIYWLEGLDGRVPVVGVPAAAEAPGGRRPASGYNLITIQKTTGGWSSQLQRYGLDSDGKQFGLVSETALRET